MGPIAFGCRKPIETPKFGFVGRALGFAGLLALWIRTALQTGKNPAVDGLRFREFRMLVKPKSENTFSPKSKPPNLNPALNPQP